MTKKFFNDWSKKRSLTKKIYLMNYSYSFDKNGKTYHTTGYEGLEIYRTIAQRVNSNLKNWVNEYMNRGV